MTSGNAPTASGILILDKPGGMSSQQAVTRVKRAVESRKVGHGGTLDPMATGVLVVGVGQATRMLGFALGETKQYQATIRLGQARVTDDAEGDPLGDINDATGLTNEAVAEAIAHHIGHLEQVPSAVSAIKVDGRRAYALVRAGQDVQLTSRDVEVTRFDLIARRDGAPWVDLDVEVECSAGTYIRALARDIGEELHVGGHLTALRRTRVGPYSLDDAVDMDHVGPDAIMTMATAAARMFPTLTVDEDAASMIAVGKAIDIKVPSTPTGILDVRGVRLLALYKPDPDDPSRSVPMAVFPGGDHG